MEDHQYGERYATLNKQMTDCAADTPAIVRAPKLEPFQHRPACPKCGVRLRLLERVFGSSGLTSLETGYCCGGRDEKERHHPIPGVQVEVNTGCFGVFEEHLHRRCRSCGYGWLMRVKGQR